MKTFNELLNKMIRKKIRVIVIKLLSAVSGSGFVSITDGIVYVRIGKSVDKHWKLCWMKEIMVQ